MGEEICEHRCNLWCECHPELTGGLDLLRRLAAFQIAQCVLLDLGEEAVADVRLRETGGDNKRDNTQRTHPHGNPLRTGCRERYRRRESLCVQRSMATNSLAKRCASPGQRADSQLPSRTVKPGARLLAESRFRLRGPGSN